MGGASEDGAATLDFRPVNSWVKSVNHQTEYLKTPESLMFKIIFSPFPLSVCMAAGARGCWCYGGLPPSGPPTNGSLRYLHPTICDDISMLDIKEVTVITVTAIVNTTAFINGIFFNADVDVYPFEPYPLPSGFLVNAVQIPLY